MAAKFSLGLTIRVCRSLHMSVSHEHTHVWSVPMIQNAFSRHAPRIGRTVRTGLHVTQVKFTSGENGVCIVLCWWASSRRWTISLLKGWPVPFRLVSLYVPVTWLFLKIHLEITHLSACGRPFPEGWNHRDMIRNANYLKNLPGNQILFWVYNCLLRYTELSFLSFHCNIFNYYRIVKGWN